VTGADTVAVGHRPKAHRASPAGAMVKAVRLKLAGFLSIGRWRTAEMQQQGIEAVSRNADARAQHSVRSCPNSRTRARTPARGTQRRGLPSARDGAFRSLAYARGSETSDGGA